MSTLSLPQSPAGVRKLKPSIWLIAPVSAALAVGVFWVGRKVVAPAATTVGQYQVVAPSDLIVKVAKDGELQAVHNIELRNLVEGKTLVQTIVPEGSFVKKGDVVLTLDSATIKQKIDDAQLEFQKSEAELTTAREALEIQRETNNANLESAKVELLLAQLELEQYLEGTYPQSLDDAKRGVESAALTLADAQKSLEQVNGLFAKGFVNGAEVEKAKKALLEATQNVDKMNTALVVLEKYNHRKDVADKKNKLAQAEAKLVRVQKENASNIAQKVADEQAKNQTLVIRKRKLESLQQQLLACRVVAPTDGLVVYGQVDRDRRVQEGAEVNEKTVMVKLPDTKEMKAVVRIPEAQVHKLQVGQRAKVRITGVKDPIWATLSVISVMSDGGQRWWNPDLKEYPVELALDQTPPNLKPGLGVQVEVFVDQRENVLTVPLPAIFSAGNDRYVFVRDNDGDPTPTKVTLGKSNETHAEVTEGLASGKEVLILQVGQGREILERNGIAIAPPQREGRIPGKGRPPGVEAGAATPQQGASDAAKPGPVNGASSSVAH